MEKKKIESYKDLIIVCKGYSCFGIIYGDPRVLSAWETLVPSQWNEVLDPISPSTRYCSTFKIQCTLLLKFESYK